MAQHDMNIANQGFPATRADLNNALQALVSNSSGTSAPSTTFANQWWYDTTNNKMYLRNEANNAWIEVAVLDQTNNEWQITTGVIQAKDGDGLALKTDDGTTRLFIKDSDGAIGIGTTSPTGSLHIIRSDNDVHLKLEGTDADASQGPVAELYRNSASPADSDELGNIHFTGRNDNSQDVRYAEIESYAMDVSDGTEDGLITTNIMVAGSNSSMFKATPDEIVLNDDSRDVDFRLESDGYTHSIFHNGASGELMFNNSSMPVGANHYTRQSFLNARGISNQNGLSGSGEVPYVVEGSYAIDTTSAGTVLSIPIFSQGSVWRRYIVDFLFSSAEYNNHINHAGTATVKLASATSLSDVVALHTTGNVSSVSVSGMNLQINFSNAYTGGLLNYEGVFVYYKLMSSHPTYMQFNNMTLN